MKQLMRRGLANFYYLRRPLVRFSLLLLVATGLVVVGGLCFHDYYRHQKMSYSEAFYTTYCLIFMEHIYEYPTIGCCDCFIGCCLRWDWR